MKILHGIVKDENVGSIRPLGNGVFENGEWAVSREVADELKNGGAIMLHAAQDAPSRHGGVIDDYTSRVATRQTKNGPQQITLYTFTYVFDDQYNNVVYNGTWGQNMKVEDAP